MPGPLITITINDSEVLASLTKLPRKVQQAVAAKMEYVLGVAKEDIFMTAPGKYLDPKRMISGVDKIGSSTIGYIEYEERGDLYPILPTQGKYLIFIGKRDAKKVAAQIVWHQYPKGTQLLAQKMIELKPWIEDQLEDAVIAAL